MKCAFCSLVSLVALLASGASASAAAAAIHSRPEPQPKPWTAKTRGAHETVWEAVTVITNDAGQVQERKHSYTELASSLNVRQPNGTFERANAEFTLTRRGAEAKGTAHQVVIAPHLADPVQITTPDGLLLKIQTLGVGYYDPTDGRSVLLATVKDSIGQLISPNEVLFLDALTPLQGSVRMRNSISGFECDVILAESPPDPQSLGLSPESRMEILSELLPETPLPVKTEQIMHSEQDPAKRARMKDPDVVDQTLTFGKMSLSVGRVFGLHLPNSPAEAQTIRKLSTRVAKRLENIEGRSILIESAGHRELLPLLTNLPPAPATSYTNAQIQTSRTGSYAGISRPVSPRATAAVPPTILMASAQDIANFRNRPGLAWDYTALGNEGVTDYTFRGSITYQITGYLACYENTVIEGGACIKYSWNDPCYIWIAGTLDCQTSDTRMAVFTAVDDDSIGETLPSSDGTVNNAPYYWFYAHPALVFGSPSHTLNGLRFRYSCTPLQGNTVGTLNIRNCQFDNTYTAAEVYGTTVNFYNVLANNVASLFAGTLVTNRSEHFTFHTGNIGSLLTSPNSSSFQLVNSLFHTVTTNAGHTDDHCEWTSASGVFQSVGGASHYLASGSSYRNAGTTSIDAELTTNINRRTTYPPIVLSNTTVLADTTLTPQAQRDTDTPDLGYHYGALDYYVSGLVVTNSTLTLTNGVALGVDFSAGSWGFIFKTGKLISEGLATGLNRIVRAHNVQEQSTGNPGTRAIFYDDASGTRDNEVRLRFTELSQLSADGYLYYTGQKFTALEWTHSAVYNPSLVVDTGGTGTLVCGLTNTLWSSGGMQFDYPNGSSLVHLRNNLFRGAAVYFQGANTAWTARDNLFDTMTLSDGGNAISNSHNAFYQTNGGLASLGVGSTNLGSLTYHIGPLGRYYLPTTSPVIDAGSRYATNAGLYHFTTTTNQVIEGSSTNNIGLHYVATDASGIPLDTDGDGLPDYLEDLNGNGSPDSGETHWNSATDAGLFVRITRPPNNSPVP